MSINEIVSTTFCETPSSNNCCRSGSRIGSMAFCTTGSVISVSTVDGTDFIVKGGSGCSGFNLPATTVASLSLTKVAGSTPMASIRSEDGSNGFCSLRSVDTSASDIDAVVSAKFVDSTVGCSVPGGVSAIVVVRFDERAPRAIASDSCCGVGDFRLTSNVLGVDKSALAPSTPLVARRDANISGGVIVADGGGASIPGEADRKCVGVAGSDKVATSTGADEHRDSSPAIKFSDGTTGTVGDVVA